jgi:N6-adenosine-specific RNA methylase IME4
MSGPFSSLPQNHYGAILVDPPWRFEVWNGETPVKVRGSSSTRVSASVHYQTMAPDEIEALPVSDLAREDCALFMWISWPLLPQALTVMEAWGFVYKTCAFAWMKAHAGQIDMFRDDIDASMGMGYWTRANSEVCLLAMRGKPKRLSADVRQGIIAPRREHSRKPDGIHERIERLVAGPYVELFARQRRNGWDVWGNQTDKFAEIA